jgi:hypothetical protein
LRHHRAEGVGELLGGGGGLQAGADVLLGLGGDDLGDDGRGEVVLLADAKVEGC